jgi:hypothetical protein
LFVLHESIAVHVIPLPL